MLPDNKPVLSGCGNLGSSTTLAIICTVSGVEPYSQTFDSSCTAVEVVCDLSGGLPSMQSPYSLFSLFVVQTWHSFGVKH